MPWPRKPGSAGRRRPTRSTPCWRSSRRPWPAGEPVTVPGFGTFDVRERGARTGRNPRTGETIEIAASRVPAFRAGKTLRDAVN